MTQNYDMEIIGQVVSLQPYLLMVILILLGVAVLFRVVLIFRERFGEKDGN